MNEKLGLALQAFRSAAPKHANFMTKHIRYQIHHLLGLSAAQQLDQHTIRILQFYEKMRDDPSVGPEAILQDPDGAICYPVLLKFAHALEKNRDHKPGLADRPAARLLGRTIGKNRFKILYRLGAGGMGEVYAARRIRSLRNSGLVAVKTLRPIDASGTDMDPRRIEMLVRRIEQESLSLGRVENYKHVVRFFEDGYDPASRLIYIVTEFLDGRSLNQLVFGPSQEPLPPAEVLWLIKEACKGLVAIHGARELTTGSIGEGRDEPGFAGTSGTLLHRDVKPSNILFDRGGRVKLIDLGLAGPAGATGMTGWGTPGFSAPEQLRGDNDLDERVDVYALGKTFYSLLCRVRRPPDFCDLPDGSDPVWDSVPTAYVDVIRRAAAHDRASRYLDAAEFLGGLESLGPAPAPDRCSERLRHLLAEEDREVNIWVGQDLAVRRNPSRRLVLAIGGATASLLVAGAVGLIVNRTPGPFSDPPGPRPEILVRKMEVMHYDGRSDNRIGNLGERSFVAHLHDKVTISAELSEPAYCYLIAFCPDGTYLPCFPIDVNAKPPLSARPGYPDRITADDAFGLDEGAGLQVFFLVVSRRELPPFSEWRAERGRAPWQAIKLTGNVVWRFDGSDTLEFTADNPHASTGTGLERAPGRKVRKDARVITDLNAWIRKDPRIESTAAIGFMVSPPR